MHDSTHGKRTPRPSRPNCWRCLRPLGTTDGCVWCSVYRILPEMFEHRTEEKKGEHDEPQAD